MKQNLPAVRAVQIERLIYMIRGQRVMLDANLASVYGVTTKALNQAVRRNRDRFPEDFVFQLTREELKSLRSQTTPDDQQPVRAQPADISELMGNRSQIVTGSQKHRDPRYLPWVFTEHGAIMAANVLNSPRAVQMSVFVVRAFVRMRAMLTDNRELAKTLRAIEKELKDRLDVHEAVIVDILRRLMDIIDPPALPEPPKKDIGFRAKESRGAYRVRRARRRGHG